MSSKRYVKTAAGHAEIQSRSLALPRPVRNLLLVINDSQPGAFWLQQIRGLVDADLASLVEAGLIAEAQGAAFARPARKPDGSPADSADTVPSEFRPEGDEPAQLQQEVLQAIAEASYSALYDTLTAQAKGQRFEQVVKPISSREHRIRRHVLLFARTHRLRALQFPCRNAPRG